MLTTTFKALADPTRLRLLGVLARGEFTVQELTGIFAMGQSRISRHLKILLQAGMLELKRQGTWSYYRMSLADPLFRDIWPVLEESLGTLAGHRADLDGVAQVLEERRRRTQAFFDLHARQWDELTGRILPLAEYLEAFLERVPFCEAVVEVGVGTGSLLNPLRRRARRVVGVDHSPAMVEKARERVRSEGLDGVELRLGEMNHLPLSDGEADGAILNMVLHHAPHPGAVFRELHRVLAPGGRLVIADLQRHEKEWARDRLADQWLGFERGDLEAWLDETGFRLEEYLSVEGLKVEEAVFVLVAVKQGSRI